ncbi:unnamed protein product [Peniophora sp. CBMAI 1063]|nr:unnamed protein product [Peniophora sp. CBMAI 1063]
MAAPWNLSPGRSIDLELGGQEVVTVELDELDPNADDIIEVLKEGQAKVAYWTRLAGEYLQNGNVDAAERICTSAVDTFSQNQASAALPAVYALLANIKLARARKAPKMKLANARMDVLTREPTRDDMMLEATKFINECEKVLSEEGGAEQSTKELLVLTRAIHQLAGRSLDDALRSFESILKHKPTNVIALLGKARILYTKRQFPAALKVFQTVLSLNPQCRPDPRIGIGLCFWSMNQHDRAKAAWQRSLEVNPDEWAASLLLGLDALNQSKDTTLPEVERSNAIVRGSKMIETAFKHNKFNAAAANALSDIFLRKRQYKNALKLAERTVQFADTLSLLTDGHVRAGRVSHADGSYDAATTHYTKAAEGQPKNVLANIGLAQMRLHNDEYSAAIRTLDSLLSPPNAPRSLESTAMLASLRSFARPGISGSELAAERSKARDMFERVTSALDTHEARPASQRGAAPISRAVAEDGEMYIEIARLWRSENIDKTGRMLRAALTLRGREPRLLNALAVLTHLERRPDEARAMYEEALTAASSVADPTSPTSDATATTILYNLARAYEDLGQTNQASDAYAKILARHPEYTDAKVREASIALEAGQRDRAHELLKEALAARGGDLNLRAQYTHFLLGAGGNNAAMMKPAHTFVHATLKDHDKHDLYALCAAGWLFYQQARESKDTSSRGAEERKAGFRRAAEFYAKALALDPLCAVAAQGLAIVSAEDALGTLGGVLPPGPQPDDATRRDAGIREALDVFAKVREALPDGSVYVNMGHCYYGRDQMDRAVESYETASKRYYDGKNVGVLMCLCRSWYSKATKDQSFASMNTALSYGEQALALTPGDKVILYNIAMVQQKAAEMLFSLPPAKRTLQELEDAIEKAGKAQVLFGTLAEDEGQVPYSKDVADQRRKYGESMLRRADEHLRAQREHEGKVQARMDEARARREEEKARIEEDERKRAAEIARQAEELRKLRAEARQAAQEMNDRWREADEDETRVKAEKAERRKQRSTKEDKAFLSDGEEDGATTPREPKKKRARKLKKGNGKDGVKEEEDGEDEAAFSGGEEGPAKKKPKKRAVVAGSDDEEKPATQAIPRGFKKQFKSAEVVDSDDDMD